MPKHLYQNTFAPVYPSQSHAIYRLHVFRQLRWMCGRVILDVLYADCAACSCIFNFKGAGHTNTYNKNWLFTRTAGHPCPAAWPIQILNIPEFVTRIQVGTRLGVMEAHGSYRLLWGSHMAKMVTQRMSGHNYTRMGHW